MKAYIKYILGLTILSLGSCQKEQDTEALLARQSEVATTDTTASDDDYITVHLLANASKETKELRTFYYLNDNVKPSFSFGQDNDINIRTQIYTTKEEGGQEKASLIFDEVIEWNSRLGNEVSTSEDLRILRRHFDEAKRIFLYVMLQNTQGSNGATFHATPLHEITTDPQSLSLDIPFVGIAELEHVGLDGILKTVNEEVLALKPMGQLLHVSIQNKRTTPISFIGISNEGYIYADNSITYANPITERITQMQPTALPHTIGSEMNIRLWNWASGRPDIAILVNKTRDNLSSPNTPEAVTIAPGESKHFVSWTPLLTHLTQIDSQTITPLFHESVTLESTETRLIPIKHGALVFTHKSVK